MTARGPGIITDVEAQNDALALEHDIDAYYTEASLPIRLIEQRRLAIIRELGAAAPADRILEVGCGGGHVLRLFRGCELTGVDVSGEMLAKARRNLAGTGATLLKGQLSELDLPDGSFDKIICTEVLEHTVDPAAVLSEIRRLLRPGGTAVITFPNDRLINGCKGLVKQSGLARLPLLSRISWGGDRYHLHVWSIPEMRAFLRTRFTITLERYAPSRLLPIRCCFRCR